MDADLIVAGRYRGPPRSGNGGYASGLVAKALGGPATVALRAPIPLDVPMRLGMTPEGARLKTAQGVLVAEAWAAAGEVFAVPPPPPPPREEALRAAGRFPGLARPFHPVCFTCGVGLGPHDGLRVFVGAVGDRPDGLVAGSWSPDPSLLDAEGLVPEEIVWAVLDCPGSVAWGVAGEEAGLLGTVSGRVLRRPAGGEETLVTAWPLERSGRKRRSGVALFDKGGELLAETRQVWISFA